MMEQINVADILKDCPSGTKLYSIIHGEVELVDVYNNLIRCKFSKGISFLSFYSDGRWIERVGECVLFPSKENRDWNKFNRPFKDGDILTMDDTVYIYNGIEELSPYPSHYVYAITDKNGLFAINTSTKKYGTRFATEEEKNILFEAIKNNGYRWNPEIKTLEKLTETKEDRHDEIVMSGIYFDREYYADEVELHLGNYEIEVRDGKTYAIFKNQETKISKPKFKVGYRIKRIKTGNIYEIIKIIPNYYITRYLGSDIMISFNDQDEYELVKRNKFNYSTLKPFDKVLVRDGNDETWINAFFGFYDTVSTEKYPFVASAVSWAQCIPYEGNEHLLGTTDECDNFFKSWES